MACTWMAGEGVNKGCLGVWGVVEGSLGGMEGDLGGLEGGWGD